MAIPLILGILEGSGSEVPDTISFGIPSLAI